MARKQSSADLQAQITRLMEQRREAERREKLEAKQAEERLALKLGRIVLDYQKASFSGFTKTDFVKLVNELVAGLNKDTTPATAATASEADDAPVEEVQDSGTAEEPAADEAVVADTGATATGSATVETAAAAETSTAADSTEKRRYWGN